MTGITTAIGITGNFENPGDPFQGVTGNFDGQGISLGVLQWNIGQGSLPPLVIEGGQAAGQQLHAELRPQIFGRTLQNSSIPDGLQIVRGWQSNNRLPASAASELRAYTGSPGMKAIQLKTIRATHNEHTTWQDGVVLAARTGQPTPERVLLVL